MHNPNNNKIVYDENKVNNNSGWEYIFNNNEDDNIPFFWDQFASNLLQDMDPAEDIKEDIPIANMDNLLKNNFYNKKLEDSIKHKIEFI